jgi:hypothetical protein
MTWYEPKVTDEEFGEFLKYVDSEIEKKEAGFKSFENSSSWIKSAAWFPDKRMIMRLHNGKEYAFKGISKRMYDNFLSSKSPGAFYNAYLKGKEA